MVSSVLPVKPACGLDWMLVKASWRPSGDQIAGPVTPGSRRDVAPGWSSHACVRPVVGSVMVAASTSAAGDQENGPASASTGRASSPSARASHSVPLGAETAG